MELTTKDLMQIFNVTMMTINNWRDGTDKKKVSALPFHTRPAGTRHTVYFKWAEVYQWSRKNSVGIVLHPVKVLGFGEKSTTK